MAPSLDRILSGLGGGLETFAKLQTNANRYKDEQGRLDQERDRQIQRDALAKTLADAQVGNLTADNERQDYEMGQRVRAQKMMAGDAMRKRMTASVDSRFPVAPPARNIDPLSPEGMDARVTLDKRLTDQKPLKPKDLPKPSLGAETAYGILPVLKQADQELDTLTGSDLGALVSRKGGILGRYFLTPEQQQYNDAIDDFALQYTTAIHGKRVNSETVHGIQNMLRIVPGDEPPTIKRKVTRRKEFYKAAERAAAGASSYHSATDNAGGGEDAPAGGGSTTPEERAALKAQGYSDAEIDAIP